MLKGASRGIGREIVSQLSEIVARGSSFLITAKTATKLEELKDEIKSRFIKYFILFFIILIFLTY